MLEREQAREIVQRELTKVGEWVILGDPVESELFIAFAVEGSNWVEWRVALLLVLEMVFDRTRELWPPRGTSAGMARASDRYLNGSTATA